MKKRKINISKKELAKLIKALPNTGIRLSRKDVKDIALQVAYSVRKAIKS